MAINDKLNGKANRRNRIMTREKASNLLKTANLWQTYGTSNYAKYSIYSEEMVSRMQWSRRSGTLLVFRLHYGVGHWFACGAAMTRRTTAKQILNFMKMTLLIDVANIHCISAHFIDFRSYFCSQRVASPSLAVPISKISAFFALS